jgi:spore maturation protein CgeB
MRTRGDHQLAGALILARRAEDPAASFWECYHERYAIAPAPAPGDSPEVLAQKLVAYYGHKLFYVAMLWVAQRNRYVRVLSRRLGDDFRVWGRNWEGQGVRAEAPVPSYGAFLRLFRAALINVNLNNGNTETGLNMRAFEITGAGGFMLCAHSQELGECFRVGHECDSFRTEDELLEKIAYYRAHPARAEQIARAGQERTLREHMVSHRLRSLLDLVRGLGRPMTAAA